MKKRLEKLCNLADGDAIADIGCDHGFLCEMLIEKGVKQIYACEVTQKNLDKARANIENYVNRKKSNVEIRENLVEYDGGSVAFVLSDGFKNLQNFIDCAIIAGMGGELILKILLENPEKLPQRLVLQPMTKFKKVRAELSKYYKFLYDEVLYDCGQFYNIMKLERGCDSFTDLEMTFGRTNLENLSSEFLAYLKKLKKRAKNIKTPEFEKLKSQIEKVEEMYE